MERSAIVERGDSDYQWQEVATVPELPADFTAWPIDCWHNLRILVEGTSMEVQVALRNRLHGNPGSCLITIQHMLFQGERMQLLLVPDGNSAVIKRQQLICHRGPGGPGLEKRY